MDEEKDVSSSSDDEEHSGIDDLVKGANDSSDEAADFAAALPIQESMSPMDEESEDQESDKEETESSDASDSKSSDLDDKPLSDYDLSDAENYFNRQNGAIVCRAVRPSRPSWHRLSERATDGPVLPVRADGPPGARLPDDHLPTVGKTVRREA